MAKTTQAFIKNGLDTAKLNAERQKADVIPNPPIAQAFVPDEGQTPETPEVLADRIDVAAAHDPANPGVPPWELNRAPSN